MLIYFDPIGDIDLFSTNLGSLNSNEQVQGIFVLTADKNEWPTQTINPLLSSLKKPVFGALVPGLIFEDQNYDRGSILVGIYEPIDVKVLESLSSSDIDVDSAIEAAFPSPLSPSTTFLFLDAFSPQISQVVDGLYNSFGLTTNYIGGGAGSLSMVQKPCIYSNSGLLQDVAIIAHTAVRSKIGVNHGWYPISRPF